MVKIVDLQKARRDRERRLRPAPPAGRMRAILIRVLVAIGVVALLALAANWRSIWPATAAGDGLVGLYVPSEAPRDTAPVAPMPVTLVPVTPVPVTLVPVAPVPVVAVAATRFPICGSGARIDCVVDGDTIWLSGTKIRVADINTPEISSPKCAAERRLGQRATLRLQALLEAGPFELRADGRDEDRYGRKLRILMRDGRSLGDVLVAEGLAHPWNGRRESWCG